MHNLFYCNPVAYSEPSQTSRVLMESFAKIANDLSLLFFLLILKEKIHIEIIRLSLEYLEIDMEIDLNKISPSVIS